MGGIRIVLKPQGVATIEVPHLMRLMEENQYDTIYHEHFSYFSVITLERVFAAHGPVLLTSKKSRHAWGLDPDLPCGMSRTAQSR